ncbi:MAG: division/cell wall cluster transcriptional repressor MraZ [Planctomycetes bacterium]|nr:division/cell wall cluster transcriptional repressor MraZ [Planctomycetota bacterium]
MVKIQRFLGTYEHAIDAKARVSVPRKLLDVLKSLEGDPADLEAYLSAGLDGCLWLYPSAAYETLSAQVDAGAVGDGKIRQFARVFYGSTEPCPIDKAGRLLIPPKLRAQAKLAERCVFVGVGNRIELWEPSAWAAHEAEGQQQFEETSKDVFQ